MSMAVGDIINADQDENGVTLYVVRGISGDRVDIGSDDYPPSHPDFAWALSELQSIEANRPATPAPPTPAEELADERARMSVTRGQFLIAAVDAGIITEATAEESAGGGWPAAFNTFLAGLTGQQRIAAKAAWADGGTVRRNNPILALIAADQGVTDTEVDDLFRAAMQIEA